jgi:uncharacterized protein (DUF305 family)
MRSSLLLVAWALGPALLVTACGGPPQTQPAPQRYPHTEADIRFMSDMIGHHRQALVMAEWAPSHGASPAVRTLAERIASGQHDEIALMQQWLRDRQQPASPAPGSSMDTTTHSGGRGHQHGEHGMLMPGMLTRAQLDELNRARGREFDRLFLQYMIQHHRGALSMVDRLFATPGAAREEATFKLANDVSADQSSEIARMERMLAGLAPAQDTP